MGYQVVITERITERRTYTITEDEAGSPQEAAETAYTRWVVQGTAAQQEQLEVTERTYEVNGKPYIVEEDF